MENRKFNWLDVLVLLLTGLILAAIIAPAIWG